LILSFLISKKLRLKGLILFLTKEEKLEEARRDVYEWLKIRLIQIFLHF
jgi:NADPH-dependent curcumin reductase CurA